MQAKTAAFLFTFFLIAIAYVPGQEEVGKSPAMIGLTCLCVKASLPASPAMRRPLIRQMDDAVTVSPTVLTLIPRGAVLLSAGRRIQNPVIRERILTKGVNDFERVLTLDKANFPQKCEHAKGELLGGIAEGWYQLGKQEQATVYLKQIMTELPGTAYAKAADAILKNKPPVEKASVTCLGCHETNSASLVQPATN